MPQRPRTGPRTAEARSTRDTRTQLIEAARQVFAEQGVENASLREINRAAGQGNTSALHYHFGDRETLLQAVLEPHHREVDARRHALLDELDMREEVDLRDLAAALVRPSAAMLQLEGGPEYLRILGSLVRHPDTYDRDLSFGRSMGRWRKAAIAAMPQAGLPLHRRFAAIQLTLTELARRSEQRRRSDHRLFVSDLIDLATGLLSAPISRETERLLADREERRNARA